MSTPIYIGWKHVYRYEIQKSIYISIEWSVNIYIYRTEFLKPMVTFLRAWVFCFVLFWFTGSRATWMA